MLRPPALRELNPKTKETLHPKGHPRRRRGKQRSCNFSYRKDGRSLPYGPTGPFVSVGTEGTLAFGPPRI